MRHQSCDGVPVCTDNPLDCRSTVTRVWESVNCCRCRKFINAAMAKQGKKEPDRTVIAAAKKEAASTTAPPSQPRRAGKRAR